MAEIQSVAGQQKEQESRWPVVAAGLAMTGLYLELPERLTLGPNWVLVWRPN